MTSRDRALQPRLRSLLILVDGKRTTDELARMTPTLDESLVLLLELGLVELADPSAPEPARTRPSAPVPLQDASGTLPLAEAQRFAVRRLSDMLGPMSDEICMRIERARDAGEFTAAVGRAQQLVAANLGNDRAQEFALDMESHRPA